MRGRSEEAGSTLVEVTVVALLLAVVLAVVGNYLLSANRTVASSAARQDDNAAAQTALGLIESNVRFACDMSIAAGTLYVEDSCGGAPTSCTAWSGTTWSEAGSQLVETTSAGSSGVANGISGLSFSSNVAYNALLTVQFNLRQPADKAGDPGGVSVNETLTAQNMSGAVGGAALCT